MENNNTEFIPEIISESRIVEAINVDCTHAQWDKVTFEQYLTDWEKLYGIENTNPIIVKEIYDNIQLPKRSTSGAAAFDVYLPFQVELKLHETLTIPTGIRCILDEGYGLLMYPRSGQGFNYRLMIVNTVPVIDSDYQYTPNEGHIMIKITYLGIHNQIALSTVNCKSIYLKNDDGDEESGYVLKTVPIQKEAPESMTLKLNKGYVQGIITKIYGTRDEICHKTTTVRKGGFGSTGM